MSERSPDEPTGRANARPTTGSAISGGDARVVPDIAALIRATRLGLLSRSRQGFWLRFGEFVQVGKDLD
jgi:hypothetical protein